MTTFKPHRWPDDIAYNRNATCVDCGCSVGGMAGRQSCPGDVILPWMRGIDVDAAIAMLGDQRARDATDKREVIESLQAIVDDIDSRFGRRRSLHPQSEDIGP